jgi:hypothetical protein
MPVLKSVHCSIAPQTPPRRGRDRGGGAGAEIGAGDGHSVAVARVPDAWTDGGDGRRRIADRQGGRLAIPEEALEVMGLVLGATVPASAPPSFYT